MSVKFWKNGAKQFNIIYVLVVTVQPVSIQDMFEFGPDSIVNKTIIQTPFPNTTLEKFEWKQLYEHMALAWNV